MRPHLPPVLLSALLLLSGCRGIADFQAAERGPPAVAAKPGTPPAPLPATDALPPFSPAPLHARLLLKGQVQRSVEDLLGPAAAAAMELPDDVPLNGFSAIGASQLVPGPAAVTAWELSAQAAAEAAFADGPPARLVPCAPSAPDDAACLSAFVRSFGRRAFRRPVTDAEVATWVALGQQAGRAYGRFDRAAQFVVAGMLQSPAFLYLAEVGEPDPSNPGRLRLTRYELAARLSYFLAGTTPPDALLAAAEAGALDSPAGIRDEARSLLALASSRRALASFFDELFDLPRLLRIAKDPATYPAFSPALAEAMREETQRFLLDLVDRGADFRDFLDADQSWVNPDLAKLYGIADVPGTGFERRTYPASTLRGGVLGQASLLSLGAHPRLTSPTRRGRFVRERLLCQPVPSAPTNVSTAQFSQAEAEGHVTMRERLAVHAGNPLCAGCHLLTDGIGLGLEQYDAIGAFRPDDDGLPIDALSTLDGLGSFEGAKALGTLLRGHPRVMDCLSRNLYRVAVGRLETEGEARPVRAVLEAFERSGFKLEEALVEIAASEGFRLAAQEVSP